MKKKAFIILSIFLANFFLVKFSFAAEPFPPKPATTDKITTAEIANVEGLVSNYQRVFAQYNNPNDPNVQAAFNAAVAPCNQLSSKIFWSTPNPGVGSYIAGWSDQKQLSATGRCVFYRVFNLTSDGREILIFQSESTAQNLWNSFKNGNTQEIDGYYKNATQTDEARKKVLSQKEKASPVSAMVGWILDSILSIISGVLGHVAALAGGVLSWTTGEALESGQLPSVVNVGWTIIRDICNMFFILALIAIGLGTILRLKEYSEYSHLLVEVVLMAILINFSKVIAVTIMDAVNMIALIFRPEGIGEIYATLMKVANPATAAPIAIDGGWMAAVGEGLAKNIYMVVATVVFIALAALFVIRLVGLYVLIIFSPLAYAARILPATHHFSEEWWEKFMKYLIWAPVAMFMLKLDIYIVNNPTFLPHESGFTFFILSGFLFATLIIAHEAGMVGANAIIHTAEHALQEIGHTVQHGVTGYAGRKWNDYTAHMVGKKPTLGQKVLFSVLNPVAAGKAWSERSHEKAHISESYAVATGKEIFGGKAGTPYRTFLAQKEEMEFAKEYAHLDTKGKMDAAKLLLGINTHEAAVRRRSLLRAAAEEGELEDVAAAFGMKYANTKGIIDNKQLGVFMRDFTESSHDQESVRFIEKDITNIGKKSKRFDYTGHSGTVDNRDPVALRMADDAQQDFQVGQIGKLEAQERARLSPQNYGAATKVKVNAKGELVDASFVYVGSKSVTQLDNDVRVHMARMQTRVNKIFMADGVIKETEPDVIEVETPEQYESIQRLWHDHQDHAKAEFAKRLGAKNPQDQIPKFNAIKVRVLKDATGALLATPRIETLDTPGVAIKLPTYDPVKRELT